MEIIKDTLFALEVLWAVAICTAAFISHKFYHDDVESYMDNCHPYFIIFLGRGVWLFGISFLIYLIPFIR